jgi:MarR family transcriptional regulator, organic hydroperoxide resistance regulator
MIRSVLDDIIDSTFEIGRYMRAKMMELAKEGRKMNLLQIHTLLLLERKPGITMKELATHLKVTGPSATVFVHRLVKMGCIARQRDRKNRKLVHLKLTTEGQKVLANMNNRQRILQRSLYESLSLADQKELARILVKVIHNFPSFSSSDSSLS